MKKIIVLTLFASLMSSGLAEDAHGDVVGSHESSECSEYHPEKTAHVSVSKGKLSV